MKARSNQIQVPNKYRRIFKIIILGITIFSIEFLIQVVVIVLSRKLLYVDLLDGNLKNPFTYGRAGTYIWGAKNLFYSRLLIYLPIWILAFRFTFSSLKINNILIRLICFDLILVLLTSFAIPISLVLFFTPSFYYLVASVIITPMLIYTVPYFRNFLKSYHNKKNKPKE